MKKSTPQFPFTNYLDLEHGIFKGTTAGQLDALFDELTQSGMNHLVIHFHGGLVSRKDALADAKIIKQAFDAGGAYSAFFVWNSDLLTDLKIDIHKRARPKGFVHLIQRVLWHSTKNKSSARFGPEDMPDTLPKLEKWAQKKEPKEGTGLIPLDTERLEDDLANDKVLIRDVNRIMTHFHGSQPVANDASYIGPDILMRMIKNQEKGISYSRTLALSLINVMGTVIKRFHDKRDHGLYTTVIEEVLVQICQLDKLVIIPTWDRMKQDTQDAFIRDPARYGGWAFLQHLLKWWKPGRNSSQRITLVGHSAGAIFIANFLSAAQHVIDSLKVDVVFLAPACSYAFLDENLSAFKKQVTHLRMFSLTNKTERGYWEVPVVYKGSLLYIITSLCEGANRLNEEDVPLVGMQRYYKAQGPYKNIRAILNVTGWLARNSGPDVVWGPACHAIAGKRSGAQKHGEFSTDPLTLKSLTHILADGY